MWLLKTDLRTCNTSHMLAFCFFFSSFFYFFLEEHTYYAADLNSMKEARPNRVFEDLQPLFQQLDMMTCLVLID